MNITGLQPAHQKELVRFLFHHGADLVLGAHPHVLQPAVCLPHCEGY
ncbi:CapA family protein [Paenibacillus sp. MBLB4367]